MSLRRGDLVTVAAKGAYTGKPRPAIVIQAGETLPYRDSVTVCLLTSELIDAPLFRVRIEPAAANGLSRASDVMADKVTTVPRAMLSTKPFGRLSAADLGRVEEDCGSGLVWAEPLLAHPPSTSRHRRSAFTEYLKLTQSRA